MGSACDDIHADLLATLVSAAIDTGDRVEMPGGYFRFSWQ